MTTQSVVEDLGAQSPSIAKGGERDRDHLIAQLFRNKSAELKPEDEIQGTTVERHFPHPASRCRVEVAKMTSDRRPSNMMDLYPAMNNP
jgi:hypothetical protein